jgi:hypothetical protein
LELIKAIVIVTMAFYIKLMTYRVIAFI